MRIDANIIDNPNGTGEDYAVAVVIGVTNNTGTTAVARLYGRNTYSGGTYVNGNNMTTSSTGLFQLEANNSSALGTGGLYLAGNGGVRLMTPAVSGAGTSWVNALNVAPYSTTLLVLHPRESTPNTAEFDTFPSLTMGEYGGIRLEASGRSLRITGATTLQGGDAAITIGTAGPQFELTGDVTGSGRLVVNGVGAGSYLNNRLFLSHVGNTFTGGTRILGGVTLEANATRSMGTGSIEITGTVGDNAGARLLMEDSNVVYNQAVTLNGYNSFIAPVATNAISGNSSLTFNQVVYSAALSGANQNYTGGVTLNLDSNILVSNASGNPLGVGAITLNDSAIRLTSDADYVWGNDVTMNLNSVIRVAAIASATGKFQSVGLLTPATNTLDAAVIHSGNGHILGVAGVNFSGTLTQQGVDLALNGQAGKTLNYASATKWANADSNLYVFGAADPLTDGSGNHLAIENNARMFVTGTSVAHVAGDLTGRTGVTSVGAGAALDVPVFTQHAVNVAGTLTIRGHSKTTSEANALTVAGATDAWTGVVDLKHNVLVVQEGNFADLFNQVKSGSGYYGTNYWGDPGINSSQAAADGGSTGIGIVANSDPYLDEGGYLFDEFEGVATRTTATILKYTWWGDSDLSGEVTLDDLDLWSTGFALGRTGWLWGDYNYDGAVTLDDLDMWSTAYATQTGPLAPSGVVPEPATLVLLGLGAVSLLTRRTRSAKI